MHEHDWVSHKGFYSALGHIFADLYKMEGQFCHSGRHSESSPTKIGEFFSITYTVLALIISLFFCFGKE